MRVGVLALQGAFREHKLALQHLGADVTEVRLAEDLKDLKGLIIPGGESTTIAKLLRLYDLDNAIIAFAKAGNAIWGTCAGAIMIGQDIVAYPEQPTLKLMDISVERNAYGRQVSSFEVDISIKDFDKPFRSVFIRAPRIARVGKTVEVLASHNDIPIMVRQDKLLASVFHPELAGDLRIHEYFLKEFCSD